ncbi:MAG: indolepyruvate ferredoxin oxidoreductase subunit alpha [Deltaproteobacteria bacterium]|nr:indolepyruvate ferredoxin oxidoreductase subunit alpha [Deltaproteobacteria bacterium]
MKSILSGNEAIAQGALDAGVSLASGYPGTPSTEILENISRLGGVRAIWAPNEKIAVELAGGVSYAGHRALAAMKHVGVNVAADPLFTLAYTGVRGGFVIVTADDPALHSSQNEQDNRRYASFTRIPMLEPSNSQEALDFTREAFVLSERFDLPFFLRTTTRISHGKSIVDVSKWDEDAKRPIPGLVKDPGKYVMIPANARVRHRDLEDRVARVAVFSESCSLNRIEMADSALGIITSGASYNYVKDALPNASILKLGLVFPLPADLIREFAGKCGRLIVVEELEPHIEEWVRILGIQVEGKSLIPRFGELDSGIVRRAIEGSGDDFAASGHESESVPVRPPIMCIGCPHRGIFHVLSRKKVFVAGDIGCYTLAVSPPLSAIHTTVCMGAGINQAAGMEAVLPEQHGKVVAVIGDSTFLHSGMGGVLNMAFNRIPATILILDNFTTAMTGRQNHPGSGFDMKGNRTRQVRWETLLSGLGIEHVRIVDAYDLEEIDTALEEEIIRDAPSVIVVRGACMLLKNQPVKREPPYEIHADKCTDCGICLRIGCPAISRKDALPGEKPVIDCNGCTGCSLCFQVCRFEAIEVLK